jgi:iron complex outermembrane recepter protein
MLSNLTDRDGSPARRPYSLLLLTFLIVQAPLTALRAQDALMDAGSARSGPAFDAGAAPVAREAASSAIVDAGTPELAAGPALEEVRVLGHRRAGAGELAPYGTGSRMNLPLEELPATLQLLDREALRERGVLDLQHALSLVPGVMAMWTYGGFQSTQIRGFQALMLVDGRRDNRSQLSGSAPQTGLFDLERVEVLRGPAAALYGYGAVGGVVNQIRRRASSVAAHELELSLGLPHQLAAHVGSQGAIAPKLSYRADLGHVTYENFRGYRSQRSQGTTTLRYAPTRRSTLQLRVAYAFDRYNTDVGIPTIEDPARPGTWILPSGARYENRYNSGNDRLKYQKLELAVDHRYQISQAVYIEARVAVTQDRYGYLAAEELSYVPPTPAGGAQVERKYLAFAHRFRPIVAQLELHADVDTGPVAHKLLLGYQLDHVVGSTDRNPLGDATPGPVDLAWPDDNAPSVTLQRDKIDHRRHVMHGLYAFDHIKLLEPLILTGGVRLDFLRSRTRREFLDVAAQEEIPERKTGLLRTPNQTTDFATTGQVGLVYTPWQPLITYVSYASAYRPLFVGAAATEVKRYDPERSQQVEGGIRIRGDGRAGVLVVDAAGYLIVRKNLLVPRGTEEQVQAGEARSRGLDVHVDYVAPRVVKLEGGYAFNHATYTNFRAPPAAPDPQLPPEMIEPVDLSGKPLPLAPRHSGSVWLRLSIVANLRAGVGTRVMGRQWADPEQRLRLPRYALLDANLTYGTGRVTFMLSGNNLVGRVDYFTSVINAGTRYPQVTPGPGREVLGTLRLEI